MPQSYQLPIVITFGSYTPMVGIQFPGRESFYIWTKETLGKLIVDLNTAYAKWDDKERASAKA